MTNLKQKVKDLGYTTDDLALRWPPSKPTSKLSRRRWVNNILNSSRQEHIDMVNGLPPNQNPSTRGEWGEKT